MSVNILKDFTSENAGPFSIDFMCSFKARMARGVGVGGGGAGRFP